MTFDLDNTLWDVDSVIRSAEQAMRDWLREHVPEVVTLYESEGIADIRQAVLHELPDLRHDVSRFRIEVTRRAIERTGVGAQSAARLAQRAFDVFIEGRHQVRYFDDALDTLDILSRRYTLAALSNGNADIRRLNLDRYFSFSVSAADAGRSKPAPDMFLRALERTKSTPELAVHVGDHLHDDIHGASNVGMHTVWVNLADQPRDADSATPSATVRRLRELPAVIEALRS